MINLILVAAPPFTPVAKDIAIDTHHNHDHDHNPKRAKRYICPSTVMAVADAISLSHDRQHLCRCLSFRFSLPLTLFDVTKWVNGYLRMPPCFLIGDPIAVFLEILIEAENEAKERRPDNSWPEHRARTSFVLELRPLDLFLFLFRNIKASTRLFVCAERRRISPHLPMVFLPHVLRLFVLNKWSSISIRLSCLLGPCNCRDTLLDLPRLQ